MSLFTRAKRAATLVGLVAAAACGGGNGGGGGCAPTDPTCNGKTGAISAFSITPSTYYEGDVVRVQASGTASDGSLDGIRVDGPTGNLIPQVNGGSLDKTVESPASGQYTAVAIEPNATTTNMKATVTRNNLTVTGQWLDQDILPNQPARYMVTGIKGVSDTIAAVIGAQSYVAVGDSGIFVFTPTAAGNYSATPRTANNGVSRTGSASSLTVQQAPQPPVANNFSLTHDEADSSSTDLSTHSSGTASDVYSLLGVPANIDATLSGSVLTVKGKTNGGTIWDDVFGAAAFKYVRRNAAGTLADTADVSVTINPEPDMTITPIEKVDGRNIFPYDIAVNGVTYTLTGPRKIQLQNGTNTIGAVLGQSGALDIIEYTLSTGRTVQLHRNQPSVNVTLGSNDLTAQLDLIASNHAELTPAILTEFRKLARHPLYGAFIGFYKDTSEVTPDTVIVQKVTQPFSMNGFPACIAMTQSQSSDWDAAFARANAEEQGGEQQGKIVYVVQDVGSTPALKVRNGSQGPADFTMMVCTPTQGNPGTGSDYYDPITHRRVAYFARDPTSFGVDTRFGEIMGFVDRVYGETLLSLSGISRDQTGSGTVTQTATDLFYRNHMHRFLARAEKQGQQADF